MIMRIRARTPGTMKFRLARVGLYRTRTTGCTCAARTAADAGSSEASRAAVRAACLGDDEGGVGEPDSRGLRIGAVSQKLQRTLPSQPRLALPNPGGMTSARDAVPRLDGRLGVSRIRQVSRWPT